MSESLALIVGYGPGVAAGVARAAAGEGFRPALLARNEAKLAEAVAAFGREGIDAIAARCDASDPGSIRAAIADVRAWAGAEVGLVLYNAANWRPGPPTSIPTEAWVEDFLTCVAGAVETIHQTVGPMRRAGRGTILLTGGGLALHPSAQAPTLSIGKAGIRSLAHTLHQELTPAGIRVGTVTICGAVEPGGPFDPAAIGAAFMRLHRGEHPGPEIVFDGT